MEPNKQIYNIDPELNSLQEFFNVYWSGMCGNIYLCAMANGVWLSFLSTHNPFFDVHELYKFCRDRQCLCEYECFGREDFKDAVNNRKRKYKKEHGYPMSDEIF